MHKSKFIFLPLLVITSCGGNSFYTNNPFDEENRIEASSLKELLTGYLSEIDSSKSFTAHLKYSQHVYPSKDTYFEADYFSKYSSTDEEQHYYGFEYIQGSLDFSKSNISLARDSELITTNGEGLGLAIINTLRLIDLDETNQKIKYYDLSGSYGVFYSLNAGYECYTFDKNGFYSSWTRYVNEAVTTLKCDATFISASSDDFVLENTYDEDHEISEADADNVFNDLLANIDSDANYKCHLSYFDNSKKEDAVTDRHFQADYTSEYFYDDEDGEKCFLFNYVEESISNYNIDLTNEDDKYLVDWPLPELGEALYMTIQSIEEMVYEYRIRHFYRYEDNFVVYQEYDYLGLYPAKEICTFDKQGLCNYIERVYNQTDGTKFRERQFASFEKVTNNE